MNHSKVEAQLSLPPFVQRHATPMTLRKLAENPLDFTVYRRGRAFGVRNAEGQMVEYIRCQGRCGELKEARRFNFEPDARNKSGYAHICRDCRNQRKRSREWAARNLTANVRTATYGNRDQR